MQNDQANDAPLLNPIELEDDDDDE